MGIDRRLGVLHATGLLDSLPEPAFDRLTRLASNVLGTPVALVSLVDADRQFFKSAVGLGEPWATKRETPLSHSFCKHVTGARAPLIVSDAKDDARVRENPAVTELGVAAYAGLPLVIDGEAIGAFCVVDTTPRKWTERELAILEDLTACVVAEIELRRATDRFAILAKNIPNAMVAMFDADLVVLALDGAMMREGLEDGVGKTMRELAGPGFDAIEPNFRRTLAGESLTFDFAIDERVLELHSSPVRAASGVVTAGMVLVLDKTKERRLDAELRRSEQIHRAVTHNLPRGGVLLVDRDLRYAAADGPLIPEFLRMTQRDSLVGLRLADVASAENRDPILQLYASAFRGERPHVEISARDRTYDFSLAPITDGTSTITHVLALLYDITDRKLEADELRRARALFETTLENIEDAVAVLNEKRTIVLANAAFANAFGIAPSELRGMPKERFFEHAFPRLEDPKSFEIRITDERKTSDVVLVRPRRRVLRRSWAPIALPDGKGFLVTFHDVTAERDLEAERERMLLVDALTGIPNRRAAEKALRHELERFKRTGTRVSVALFDIDHFKRVNDTFGHAVGDEVLRLVGTTLARQARLTDTVARWGGEEFIAVLSGDLEGARTFCERARRAVESLAVSPVEKVTVSVGVAELAAEEETAAAIGRADTLLYEAKRTGRNQVR